MKKIFVLLALFVLFTLPGTGVFAESNIDDTAMEKRYQHDADTVRLRHLKHYAELIREYISATGRFPFQGADPRTHVFIATTEQRKHAQSVPEGDKILWTEDFREELAQGLNREVRLWFDPQRALSGPRAIWYYYSAHGKCYVFTVNLFSSYGITRQMNDHSHLLGFTNCPSPEANGIHDIDTLLTSPEYIEASNREFNIQTGWFEQLEEANR